MPPDSDLATLCPSVTGARAGETFGSLPSIPLLERPSRCGAEPVRMAQGDALRPGPTERYAEQVGRVPTEFVQHRDGVVGDVLGRVGIASSTRQGTEGRTGPRRRQVRRFTRVSLVLAGDHEALFGQVPDQVVRAAPQADPHTHDEQDRLPSPPATHVSKAGRASSCTPIGSGPTPLPPCLHPWRSARPHGRHRQRRDRPGPLLTRLLRTPGNELEGSVSG